MVKRTKLADRVLPFYTRAEELVNTVTHGVGIPLSIAALVLCIMKAVTHRGVVEIVASSVYGGCMILVYSMSALYHGLKPGMGKKVLQVLDHCAIYFLIAGSYTLVCLGAIRRAQPVLGWSIFCLEWALTALAATLTAIDLKKFETFSTVCYIGMGWAIVPLAGKLWSILGPAGFALTLGGGIAYTLGAVLCNVGTRVRWMHSIFHLLVVAGSTLHFFAFYLYAI